ncbi:Aldo/keto reductase, partial [Aureobasidium sp. EXF-3399]
MVKVIAGLMGSSVASGSVHMSQPEQLRAILTLLGRHGIRELDTARVYNNGQSEQHLGATRETVEACNLTVATKAPGFVPGSLSYDNIIRACNDSLAATKQQKFDLYYFHGPDRQTPLDESCRAMNQLHSEGKFDRFGISNFRADEVHQIVDICHKNSWVSPSVYQGVYNPLLRAMEPALLPVLRGYGIAFYAYSPLGGGFFSRPMEQLRMPPAGGRMDQMKVFQTIYVNDMSLELLQRLTDTCDKAGVTVREAALRWLMHHSSLGEADGIILGASSEAQMEQNLAACEGAALPDSVVECFAEVSRQYRAAGKDEMYCV